MGFDSDAAELFCRHADTIYRIAVSYTNNTQMAQDAVQEVFLRYLKTTPHFESDEHARAWLIRVAVNCCKSMHSSAWFRKTCPLEEHAGEADTNPPMFGEEESSLYETLMKLPPKYRIVLYLRYYEEYSIKEIARLLGITPNLASVRLKRAKKLMKQKMEFE